MLQEKRKRIHLIYGCAAAVLLVVLGVALILSCLDIYNSGTHSYSAESIGDHFEQIGFLVYLSIAVIIGGIVLNLALPLEKKRPKAVRDDVAALNKQKAKTGALSGAEAVAATKEVKCRCVLRIVTGLIFTALMVYPAIYFADGSHFTITNLSSDIISAVLIVMIPAAIGLMLCFVCSVLETKSIRRETEVYKTAATANKGQTTAPVEPKNSKNWLLAVRCVIVVVGVCFIVLGILNGGMRDVFDKAVAICTECIGLG